MGREFRRPCPRGRLPRRPGVGQNGGDMRTGCRRWAMGGQYLTLAEIEAQYPNEWVLIDRPRTTKYQEVLGGYVVCHSKDREAITRAIDALLQPIDVAVQYNGPPI